MGGQLSIPKTLCCSGAEGSWTFLNDEWFYDGDTHNSRPLYRRRGWPKGDFIRWEVEDDAAAGTHANSWTLLAAGRQFYSSDHDTAIPPASGWVGSRANPHGLGAATGALLVSGGAASVAGFGGGHVHAGADPTCEVIATPAVEVPPPDVDALVKEARDAVGELDMSGQGLGRLPTEAIQALAETIGSSRSITTLHLDSNDLDNLPTAVMQALAGAIGSSLSITTLHLWNNDLGNLPTEAMQALAEAIGSSRSIATLRLDNNDLGKLPTAAMQALAEAIGSSRSITKLTLAGNDLWASFRRRRCRHWPRASAAAGASPCWT